MSGIGDKPPTLTIDKQVELFEHRLANQDFVTQDERFIERVSAFELHHKRLRDAHSFSAPVGVLGEAPTSWGEAEA